MKLPEIARAEKVIRKRRKTRDTAIADCLEQIPKNQAELKRARLRVHPADRVMDPESYYQARARVKMCADNLEMYEHFLHYFQHEPQFSRREYRQMIDSIKQELAALEAEITADPGPGKVKDFEKAVRRGNAALEALQRDLYRDTTGPAETYTPAGWPDPETPAENINKQEKNKCI